MKGIIRGPAALLLLVGLAAAVALASCGPAKTLASSREESIQQEYLGSLAQKADRSVVDSLLYSYRNLREEMTELRETVAEQIPLAQAQVTIPAQNLLDLPEGAKYGTSEGRASVEIQRIGDSYVATGRCDSVARQCARYERQVFRQQSTIDSLNSAVQSLNSKLSQMEFESLSAAAQSSTRTTESSAPPLRRPGRWLAAGTLIGIAGTFGAQALWKRVGIGGAIRSIISKIF